MCVKSLLSCLTLGIPMDCSPPGSSVHGILQARILAWVAMPSPRDLPHPGIRPTSFMSPTLAGGFFTVSVTWEAQCPPRTAERLDKALEERSQALREKEWWPRAANGLLSPSYAIITALDHACSWRSSLCWPPSV